MNTKKVNQLNNKGFSLIELIVIMVIVVIMATAVVVSFVNSSDQKVKASTTVIYNYLRDGLSYSLTKGKDNSYFEITYDGKRYTVADNQGHSEQLKSGVSVTYDIQNGTSGVEITEERPLMLSFSSANGSFNELFTSLKPDGTPDYTNNYVERINIIGNGYTKTIRLYPKTGEYEIED